jgi:hypothetical protein
MIATLLSNGRTSDIGRYPGKMFNRALTIDSKWVVMTCGKTCTVFDFDMFEKIHETTWSMLKSGYVAESNIKTYLHTLVLPNANANANMSVDHINQIKTDNRRENLRLATQAEQNSNRATRADKIPACALLVAAGVTHLPKGIRKDESLDRYTCVDHPVCKKLDKSRNFAGTRCKAANEVARFKDCLEIYIDILQNHGKPTEDEVLFFEKRLALAQEYNTIIKTAHEFDNEFPDVLYAIDDLMNDDLSYAKIIMQKLSAVEVVKGPANLSTNEVFMPNINAIKRFKGETMTMYDACFAEQFKELNWDVDGSPRIKIPSNLQVKYPEFTRGSLMNFIWTQLLKKTVPEGYVVVPFSCDTFDVRKENMHLIEGTAAYRVTHDEWVVPEDVNIGMEFLPHGITVNKSKVMINQAAELRPNEFGANAAGRWATTITQKNTIEILINTAIKIMIETHGQDEFTRRNDKYQRLMATYRAV